MGITIVKKLSSLPRPVTKAFRAWFSPEETLKKVHDYDVKKNLFTATTADNHTGLAVKIFEPEKINPELSPVVLLDPVSTNSSLFRITPDGTFDINLTANSLPGYLFRNGFTVALTNFRDAKLIHHRLARRGWPGKYRFDSSASLDHFAFFDLPSIIDLVLEETGAKKVNLLGYSRGGIVAKMYLSVAENFHDHKVDRLITIGSPLYLDPEALPLWLFAIASKMVEISGLDPLKYLALQTTLLGRSLILPFWAIESSSFLWKIALEKFIKISPFSTHGKEFLRALFMNLDPRIFIPLLLSIEPITKGETKQFEELALKAKTLKSFIDLSQFPEEVQKSLTQEEKEEGRINYTRRLKDIKVREILIIGGHADPLATPASIKVPFTLMSNKKRGHQEETNRYLKEIRNNTALVIFKGYEHLGLILGKKAPAEIYPLVSGFFEKGIPAVKEYR